MPITSKEALLKVLILQAKIAYYETQAAKRAFDKARAEEGKAMRKLVEHITRNK